MESGMEARVAMLEASVSHIEPDIHEIKGDMIGAPIPESTDTTTATPLTSCAGEHSLRVVCRRARLPGP